jgi:hypothetical protein
MLAPPADHLCRRLNRSARGAPSSWHGSRPGRIPQSGEDQAARATCVCTAPPRRAEQAPARTHPPRSRVTRPPERAAGYLRARGSATQIEELRVMLLGVFRTCRYCGDVLDRARRPLEVCSSCADSPLCDGCGHTRGAHTKVFVPGGPAGCTHLTRDFQSLSALSCDCTGFRPIHGALRDAAFLGHISIGRDRG